MNLVQEKNRGAVVDLEQLLGGIDYLTHIGYRRRYGAQFDEV